MKIAIASDHAAARAEGRPRRSGSASRGTRSSDLGTHGDRKRRLSRLRLQAGRARSPRARPSAGSRCAARASASPSPPTAIPRCAARKCPNRCRRRLCRSSQRRQRDRLGARLIGPEMARACVTASSPPLSTAAAIARRVDKLSKTPQDAYPMSTAIAPHPTIPKPSIISGTTRLAEADPEVFAAIVGNELGRQRDRIELIASENIAQQGGARSHRARCSPTSTPRAIRASATTAAANTPTWSRRWPSSGPSNCSAASSPTSSPTRGSQMNQAVFFALLEPGDTFMGLDLAAGGHLTHGSPVNMSGKWFNAVPYGVRREDQRLDMDEVRRLAREHKPKLIIAGAHRLSAPLGLRRLPRDRRRGGRVAAGRHVALLRPRRRRRPSLARSPTRTSSPPPRTRSLRGPRGGVILTNDEAMAKKINMAVFPGLQGGPLVHVIAAKAVAFGEALRPEFKAYARSVVENAKALAASLEERGLRIVSGGTDNHLMLVDLTPKDVTGKAAEKGLDRAYLTCNKNGIPFDTEQPVRHLGRPARHAGRHHPRVRPGRVPQDRRTDRRSRRRACAEWRRRRWAGRRKRPPPRRRTVRRLPCLSREMNRWTMPEQADRQPDPRRCRRGDQGDGQGRHGASLDQAGADRRRRRRCRRMGAALCRPGRSAASRAPASCSTSASGPEALPPCGVRSARMTTAR